MTSRCEVPKRRLRQGLQPVRIVLGLAALATMVIGVLLQDLSGLLVLGLGVVILLAALVFPVVREVEFGFPSGVKVSTALRDRGEELRQAFVHQKGDLGLYTHLLCEDPSVAAELLEAAWAKTAAAWRGPVTDGLRLYVLCVFVHLLDSHGRWMEPAPGSRPAPEPGHPAAPLAALSRPERTVVVLREFADLTLAQIAALTGRPLPAVAQDLQNARAALTRQSVDGGAS